MRLPRTTVIDDGDGPSQLQTLTLLAVRRLPPPPSTAFSEPKGDLRNWRFAGGGERTTVPFQLLNNHIYAEVKVDGKGPFLFIFDTGGQEILMPATAKALAQGISGDAAGRGAGEGTVSVGFTRVRSIRIGDLELGPETVVVEPFETRAVDGVDEGGMIGFGTFRRLVTRIDYGRHTLTFIEPAHFDPRGAGTPIPFAFYNTIPQVEGAFESLEGKFDIDTGSRTSIDITTPFVRAHDLIARHPKGVLVVDGWGVGGPSRDFVTRGGRLRLGSVTVPSVVAGLSTQRAGAFTDPNYEGNVGAGILKRFVVTFDYGHRIMYLKPIAGPLVDVGTFDRSGMWINEVGDGVEVMSLSVAGPADRAGLKVGDHIVAIDGERTTQVSLSDLRRKLRDDPAGTIEHLEVKSGGEERKVALTLRDQI
ncbi:MAG: PDZ domain-containing protein [Caulobacteraceae bacterium]